MTSVWLTRPLGELCQFTSGLWTGKNPPYTHVGVLRMTNFASDGLLSFNNVAYLDVESKALLKRQLVLGDVILEKSGGGPNQPVGRVALFERTDEAFSLSNFTASIRVVDPNELDYRYLHKFLFWLHLSGATAGMQNNSTNIRNLNLAVYKAAGVPFPPIAEQKRIVAILDEAFEGIAIAAASAERNLRNSRALFDSQLDGVFSRTCDGYANTTLGAEIELLPGFAFKSAKYTEREGDVRLLRGDNIVPGSLRWDGVKRWPVKDAAEHSRFRLNEGDVVLAMDRPWVSAGLKYAMLTASDLPALLVQRVARLRSKPGLDNRFLLHLIASAKFMRHVVGVQTGSGVPHISGAQIESFVFSKPHIEEQRRVAQHLDELMAQARRLESIYQRKLEALDALKKSLLNEAFSGNL